MCQFGQFAVPDHVIKSPMGGADFFEFKSNDFAKSENNPILVTQSSSSYTDTFLAF